MLNMRVRLEFTKCFQWLLDIYITSKISEGKTPLHCWSQWELLLCCTGYSEIRGFPYQGAVCILGQSSPQQWVFCWWYKWGYLLESRHAAGKEIISACLLISPFHQLSVVLASWEMQCSQTFPSWAHLVRERADGWPWLPALHTGSPDSIKVVERLHTFSAPQSLPLVTDASYIVWRLWVTLYLNMVLIIMHCIYIHIYILYICIYAT